jgi:hypothetical protein
MLLLVLATIFYALIVANIHQLHFLKGYEVMLRYACVPLVIFCGLVGAVMDNNNAYWWGSLSWLFVALTPIAYELYYEWRDYTSTVGDTRIFGSYFYPILQYSSVKGGMRDVSIESSGMIIGLTLTALWG